MAGKQLFFSYGHDCTRQVLRIKRDLEREGYQVWLDTEGIVPGADWRGQITEAILACDMVVAFLSEHSLRRDSVCLNELAIAVSHKSGFIKTVLLEPGIIPKIPATISGIQYCDMGEWEERAAGPAEAFETWYEEKFRQLTQALTQSGDRTRDAQLRFLEQVLSPALSSNRRNIELQKPFVSRTWMEQRIDSWLERKNSGQYLLLYGGPGTGKSAFSAHYFHFDSRVAGSVFCEWGCRNYSSAAQILKSIAYQMALKLPTYRMRLAGLLEGGGRDLSRYAVQELFDLLLLQPLYGDTAGENTILLIIDGADEANENGSNELAQLLSANANRLPPFLKFLITSRNDAIVQRYFSDCQELRIDTHGAENTQDICRYLREGLWQRLAAYPSWRREQILAELAEKSGSSFLYAELLMRSILSGQLSLDQAGAAPRGLHGLYFNWMQRKFPDPDQYEEDYLPVLSLIAAANRLPVELLDKALGIRGVRYKKLMRQMKTFLETERDALGAECVYFFHRSFAEWLCGEDADVYELSPEEGVDTLARTMYASYRAGELTDFEAEYLLDYLRKNKMVREYEQASGDRDYLLRLFRLAQSYEAAPGGFENGARIYLLVESLLPEEKDAGRLRAGALCGRGRCLFAMGRYEDALAVLVPARETIRAWADPRERMQALVVLGSAYDWKGDRVRSVECFQALLELADSCDAPDFLLRGYEGLIWNEHFNHMDQALERLGQLRAMELSEQQTMTCELCMARVLLSQGKLEQALACYDRCFSAFNFSAGQDFYTAKKNRMLLLEILPACFDNQRYLDGVRCGQHLWTYLQGRGWLEECYCASWLALNELRLGNGAAAEQYLCHAQACNNTIQAAARSAWMEMHLTSVEAFLRFEQGEYGQAAACHRRVLELARSCADSWVEGDACFELLIIALCFDPAADGGEPEALLGELEEVSASSGLIHLRCKCAMAKGLLAASRGEPEGVGLAERARTESDGYHLASMDPVVMGYLEYRILAGADPEGGRQAALRLEETISRIAACNRSPLAEVERPLVRRIREEVLEIECRH